MIACGRGAGPERSSRTGPPAISIIAPSFNERDNVGPLCRALALAMDGIDWELIIVDDDSPDGTAQAIWDLACDGHPVRCVRRVGRRGLSSAVVEGILAAGADIIAVIDADLQHDERILPAMLDALKNGSADLVIGSRYIGTGSVGDWSKTRQRMSSFATACARLVLKTELSDPMSGFFAIRRDVFEECLYGLSQQGYKILLDILSSSPRPLKLIELPYTFRHRRAGESKIDFTIIAEYLFLLIEKMTAGVVPAKFVLFSMVGGLGLIVHLLVLGIMKSLMFSFNIAQLTAIMVAMTFNYVLNNSVTYRPRMLKGQQFVTGFLMFCLASSLGAVANIGVADLVLAHSSGWPIAGVAGAMMSAVFNFGAASQLVWHNRRRAPAKVAAARDTPAYEAA